MCVWQREGEDRERESDVQKGKEIAAFLMLHLEVNIAKSIDIQ